MSNYSEDQALLVRLINADCFKDYYTILGVDKNRTSPEEIRKEYKKLCLRVHPDKNRAPGSDEAFKKIDNAYRKLLLLHTSTASPPPHRPYSNPNSNSNSNSNVPKSNPNPKPRRYSCTRRDSDPYVFVKIVGGVFVGVCVFGVFHNYPVPIYPGSTQTVPLHSTNIVHLLIIGVAKVCTVTFSAASTGPGKIILPTALAIAGIYKWWS